jgi:hypothetical protein
MLAYLDQNIIGYIHDGKLALKGATDIQWVYSREHFTEIARGGKAELLNVLGELKACQLEVVLDENFKVTDMVRLHSYSDPIKRYERYLEAIHEIPFDQTPQLDLIARCLGADNFESAQSAPNRMGEHLRSILEGLGPLGEPLAARWKVTQGDLAKMIEKHLKTVQPLESIRQRFGTSRGRGTNFELTQDPILALWKLLSPYLPDMSADQFFGFDPPYMQGYVKWPLFLGIIGCHSVLNVLGYRPDKGLSKPDALPNILSDGSHIAHAAFCAALISEDRRLCAKARAIYRHKAIQTEVIEIHIGSTLT